MSSKTNLQGQLDARKSSRNFLDRFEGRMSSIGKAGLLSILHKNLSPTCRKLFTQMETRNRKISRLPGMPWSPRNSPPTTIPKWPHHAKVPRPSGSTSLTTVLPTSPSKPMYLEKQSSNAWAASKHQFRNCRASIHPPTNTNSNPGKSKGNQN